MGVLLSSLRSGKVDPLNIFVDFEKADVSEAEEQLFEITNEVLSRGPDILEKIKAYEGCEAFIRTAITTPTPENEEAAWKAVLPAVDRLQEFYDFATELENIFPLLTVALCAEEPKHSIKNKQALAKELATVMDFVLRFDDLKMINPAIQNDFSYYRRTLNRMKINKKDGNVRIRDEMANKMSLFFAYPTPMMKVLSDTTAKYLAGDADISREALSEGLAVMANVCFEMVHDKKFEKDETNLFCLRAMTGTIILYDHINTLGAFHKKSGINIKGAILQLKNFRTSDGSNHTDGLLNALRFTTVHLNDPDTPASVKALLHN